MKSELENLEEHIHKVEIELSKLLDESKKLTICYVEEGEQDTTFFKKSSDIKKRISKLQKDFYLSSIEKFFMAA